MFKNKEALEKERLIHRTGGYHRYEDIGSVTTMQQDCASFIPEKERFIVTEDVVKLELHDRERELAARNDKTEAWRASRYNRDDQRWQAVEKKELDHQNNLDRLQDDPMIGRKNCGGQPYNIVNHRYDDNLDGQRLKYHDDMVKFRGEVRSTHLAARGHLGYNPITGEQTHELKAPKKPDPDPQLRGFF
jgi:hypothetical protein